MLNSTTVRRETVPCSAQWEIPMRLTFPFVIMLVVLANAATAEITLTDMHCPKGAAVVHMFDVRGPHQKDTISNETQVCLQEGAAPYLVITYEKALPFQNREDARKAALVVINSIDG